MTDKEFRSELKFVVTRLRCNPNLKYSTFVYLDCYLCEDSISIQQTVSKLDRVLRSSADRKAARDEQYIFDLLIEQYFLGYDLLESTLDDQLVKRLMRAWLSKISRWQPDLLQLGKILKLASELLLKQVSDNSDIIFRTINGFKHHIRSQNSDLDFFFEPIYSFIDNWIQNRDEFAFRVSYQWCEYIQRANAKSLDLVPEMMREYVEYEQSLLAREYPMDILKGLKEIIHSWFPRERVVSYASSFQPKHGPGSSSQFKGRMGEYMKYCAFSVDSRLCRPGPFDISITDMFPSNCVGPREYTRRSEIVAVPKSLLKNRIISKEPVALMYMQQGWYSVLYKALRDSECDLSKHIDLAHPERSAEMAYEGSIGGEYATIDLSSASDSVTKTLVTAIFPSWIRTFLFSCRSDETQLPSGEIISLEKFAPMGSDLCFLTETIVFAAFCELAVKESHGRRSVYTVYGDDIVIEERYAQKVVELLERMGFTVNRRKSYTIQSLHNFREACGGEFLNGRDVTPIRTSRRRSCAFWILNDPDQLDQMLSDTNNSFDHGMFHLRKVHLHRLKRSQVKMDGKMGSYYVTDLLRFIPFTEDGHIGLKTFPGSATNFQLTRVSPSSKSTDFQYRYYKLLVKGSRGSARATRKRYMRILHTKGHRVVRIGDVKYFDHWIKTLTDDDPHPAMRFWESASVLICDEVPTLWSTKTFFKIKRCCITER